MAQRLVLEKNPFREIMFEARELLNSAMKPQNNLMHHENIDLYDSWAPYMMFEPKNIYESPGYKIAFLQVMSIVMALKEKETPQKIEKNDLQNIEDKKIINFSRYKDKKVATLTNELSKL